MPYTLSREDEKRLGRIIGGDDQAAAVAARNELVLANLGLVYYVLSRLIRLAHASDHDDVISEGSVALIEAASRWNPDHDGYGFATYARTCINRHMFHYLRRRHKRPFVKLKDLHADRSPLPEDTASIREDAERYWERVKTSPELASYIFAHYLGLCDGVPKTFADLGRHLDLNPSTVKRLYYAARARVENTPLRASNRGHHAAKQTQVRLAPPGHGRPEHAGHRPALQVLG
jgi:RNA polymerase sigma factor (sigma-70 family)